MNTEWAWRMTRICLIHAIRAVASLPRQRQHLEPLRLADRRHDIADHLADRRLVAARTDGRSLGRTAAAAERGWRLVLLFCFVVLGLRRDERAAAAAAATTCGRLTAQVPGNAIDAG